MTPEECAARGGSGDPRTLWVSEDGRYAVAYVHDAPSGVKRSGCYSMGQKPVDRIIGYATTYASDRGLAYTNNPLKYYAHVAAFLRADLFWERGLRPGIDLSKIKKDGPPLAAPKMVPDWPLTCPKCSRVQSAVLLFSSYDCKHGCYRRGS